MLRKNILIIFPILLTLSMAVVPVIAVAPSWSRTYNDYINYGDSPIEFGASVEDSYSNGVQEIQFAAAMGVTVYQYHQDFDHNSVNIRLAFTLNTEVNEYASFDVDAVTFFVEKDTSGTGLNKQAVEWLTSTQEPYMQGEKFTPLGQANVLGGILAETRGHWAYKTLKIATGLVSFPAGMAWTLIDLAASFYPVGGTSLVHAGYSSSEVQAKAYWAGNAHDDAYCFNCFRWKQNLGYNPSTYMGLKIYAVFSCYTDPWNVLDPQYTIGPLYLRINHKSTGGGGGGCPYLSVYDGSSFVGEGKLNIHNPEGTDIVLQQNLTTMPAARDNRYYLRLTEESFHFSEIDQVKLLAVMKNGKIRKLPLLSAIHSSGENVRRSLRKSDDIRSLIIGQGYEGAEASEYITLAFASLSAERLSRVSHFIFLIEGHNAKTPW